MRKKNRREEKNTINCQNNKNFIGKKIKTRKSKKGGL